MTKLKAIVVGRHPLSGDENIEEVSLNPKDYPNFEKSFYKFSNGMNRLSITFPTTIEGCVHLVHELIKIAEEKEVALVFQGIPTQLVIAITQVVSSYKVHPSHDMGGQFTNPTNLTTKVGVIISKAGERGVTKYKSFSHTNSAIVEEIKELGEWLNPRTKITKKGNILTFATEPPMPFIFDKILWFN